MKHLLVLLLLMTAAFARATPEVFLRNPALQCRLTCGDGDLAVFEITDTDSNHRLVLASGITPTLVLPGGKTFAIGPVLSSFRKDAGGNSRSATIGGNPHGLEGQCAIALHEDPAYAVASLTLKATRDLAIEEIVFLDTALESGCLHGGDTAPPSNAASGTARPPATRPAPARVGLPDGRVV